MSRIKQTSSIIALAFLGQSCAGGGNGQIPLNTPKGPDAQKHIAGLDPAKPLPTTENQKQTDAAIERWFAMYPTRRAYIQLDKPIYQPGETIWFRANLRTTKDLTAFPQAGVTIQLISPKGAVVLEKRVLAQDGVAANDFDLPEEAQGGEYILQLTGDEGTMEKRPLIVASYEAPRLKKTLEFLRKAYGPGDSVSAAISVSRATGEPFASKKLTGVVTVDDVEVARVPVTTDAQGNAVVKFKLPPQIAREDGLLTVMADDGGVTESIQKRIPIVLKTVDFAMFPEGGDLIEGLPGRVYFTAKNTIGKPADVEGRVLDDQGKAVAEFKSLHDGMGRFELVPEKGRTYHVELNKPAGIAQQIAVPLAKADGCVIQTMDDFDSKQDELKLATWCTASRTVMVETVLREKRMGSTAIDVTARRPALIVLPMPRSEQGALRVTLFSDDQQPLAERLVYRGRRADMNIEITADRKTFGPRDAVTLTVKTTDLTGKPVQASMGLSVVDDTVLSFADDKTGHLLSRLYLESELGTDAVDSIEEPNFYFSDKPDAAASMDLLMGTKGWRRFEWQLMLQPQQYGYGGGYYDGVDTASAAPMEAEEAPMAAPPAPEPDMARADNKPQAAKKPMAKAPPPKVAKPADKAGKDVAKNEKKKAKLDDAEMDRKAPMKEQAKQQPRRGRGPGGGGQGAPAQGGVMRDEDFGGDDLEAGGEGQWAGWAPVRVFPAPTYKPGYDGPRTDFRETIFWAHDVRTGKDGTAKVTFYLSDAVTSFRVSAEGLSAGGLPGRGDSLVQSKLPVNLDVKMPLEVSTGDAIKLPVSLTNETDREITANVQAAFGASFKLGENPFAKPIKLAPGEKKSFYFPLTVVGQGGEGEVEIAMQAEGLKDEIHKKIRVVPLGFPFEVALSGTAKGTMKHDIDLAGAMPGTISAKVIMYPSPLASMTAGAAALIREPGGCFEQTSATNYPNIMVMQYLESNEAADPNIVADASGKLNRGYKLLTGYESPEKGYEWFGENPGHEALTAYGLMEFKDMSSVMDGVDNSMVERTAAWLMTRRDGKGGYLANPRALDSFGRASYETTAGYITWALSEAGRVKGMDKELAMQKKAGLESKDPYIVALAANTWLNVDAKGADTQKIVGRLAEMQDKGGAFKGAAQSITMSGGESLDIETTAIATLALIKASPAGEYEQQLRGSVKWLNDNRGGYGEWSNTQATVLGLKALTAYTEHTRQTQASGVATIFVNGKEAGKIAFEKGRKEALEFDDIAANLKPGKNTIEIKLDSEATMPYSVAIEYRSAKPQSSDKATIGVSTKLAKKSVKMGEGVKLHATITNKTDKGQPMTLARIGLPGGLTFQTWQLKELKDKKLIGFYETRQREVIVYLRDMKPGQVVEVDFDLMATVPGQYVGPASSAYLYYTDEDKSWAAPMEFTVER